LSLRGAGWESTLARFKPASNPAPSANCTVGDFFAEVKAKADGKPKTIEGYCKSFRKIVADIYGIEGGAKKYDYRKGGQGEWLEKIHAVKLADVTPEKVQGWKRTFLLRSAGDPLRERSARVSVNSFLRQAKSLFAPDVVKHLGALQIPRPLPFDAVDFEKRHSMRYKSTFDVETLVADAQAELAATAPEQFKIFLLAVMGGLRRNEIDKLEWSAFRWREGVVRIEATEYFRPKSEDSTGDVELDPEIVTLFRSFGEKATGRFVIESPNGARPAAKYQHYRCEREFEKLTGWLRSKGVATKTPLHTLRKEYGSQVCAKHGIYAASHALRHADMKVTAAHYLDKKRRATAGMGHLLILGGPIN
jgi:integrase